MNRASSIRKKFYGIRNKSPGTDGRSGSSRETIIISNDLPLTYSKVSFLLSDTGSLDRDRILIFSTERNLKIQIDNWLVDGTFAVSTDLFYQLFTINTFFEGLNIILL